MKRAFVTGGSGFVGGRLIAALRARSIEVAALVRSDKAAAAVTALGATAVRGDLDNPTPATRAIRGCDTCFHAAAHVSDLGPLDESMRVNVFGTKHMLDAARVADVKRFVHFSTEAVLANGRPIVRADETWPYARFPAGPYPQTKAVAERVVLAANHSGLETIVVRPRFIWGKGDLNVLPKLVDTVKRGKFAWIGGGRYLTSTCHVDNVIEGALLAADRGAPGEVYFLTDGEPVEFRAFVTQLVATQGVEVGTRNVPRWLARGVAAATSWMKAPPLTKTALALIGVEVTVDDGKARRELGYASKKTREEGLAELRA